MFSCCYCDGLILITFSPCCSSFFFLQAAFVRDNVPEAASVDTKSLFPVVREKMTKTNRLQVSPETWRVLLIIANGQR